MASAIKNVEVVHGGETVLTTVDEWEDVCNALIAKHGNGVPKVRTLTEAEIAAHTAPKPTPRTPSVRPALRLVPPVQATPVPSASPLAVPAGRINVLGQARSTADLEAARQAGFAPKHPLYDRGSQVNEIGVANARKARADFDAMPTIGTACRDLSARVASEYRQDCMVATRDLTMDPSGEMSDGKGKKALLEERCVGALVTHLGMPAGASAYLPQVWPELRAANVNAWVKDRATSNDTVVLRTRDSRAGRAVYGVVSEAYCPFDVDQIAHCVAKASPRDARGTVTYDGYRTRIEVLFHSTVQPEEFVAGEFFRAGVVITTDDTGGGSVQGSAVVWQNLCLNLIVIDQAEQDLFRIRHLGDVGKLIDRFRTGFDKALGKIDHFIKAWGFACHENILESLPAEEKGMRIEDAIPGFFNGIIERELVPVRGKRDEVIRHLTREWYADDSSAVQAHGGATRAAVVNAFTRYAHTGQSNPWLETEIERAAGSLLQSRKPLPYIALAE